ncbi:ATP-dependent DNA helicase recG [Weissella viridescens]|uniref:ATP-dependent DNA helicase recG n=1 Tax=Weissella viridescens TaxID=1629 RepID=A0A380P8L5_WEIVI|nr:ATP-dependent DNA helicase recG [Weissella viridescens]
MLALFLKGGTNDKSLMDSVGQLTGVGPKREQALNHLDIYTIADLVTYYPTRYDDLAEKLPSQTADGEK